MIKLTHPKIHSESDIIELLNKFEKLFQLEFKEWMSIEAKGRAVEVNELQDVQATVFQFLQNNAEVEGHMALISAWMDMRTAIRTVKLGMPKNVGGIRHG
ncbi:hypothetical protein [Sphingobium sp. LB126]|uniref:hypothetical protein n=1 Tax=Sphingobium sp. LB126 TaxID=1983755 RepID=UPI0012FE27DD|nr:hypothetical protein [Sphingobium sp. LB126]